MTRETIEVGIDLGTTTTILARFAGRDVRIVKNNENLEFTPSAVWIPRSGDVFVGRKARDRAELDADDVATEFKQQMGLDDVGKTFASTGRRMTPPELSAQVLMSVGRDLQRREDMPLDAAVITVPAAFELHQCDATRRAAELAGIRVSPLLQEPTAAAFAYSYGRAVDQAYWLVFDLGGGTFDASVINVREGEFTVVKHAGDNQLGGKRIDWAVVEKLLVPAVRSERPLHDLVRGNPQWAGNIAKLKLAAELAKIELSDATATPVFLNNLDDADGGRFDVELTLRREDIERLAEPLYRRAVNLCRRALEEARLGPGAIERVILVGGATLAPHLRALLADPRDGLGITLDHTLDPVTVVARGAAIFAGTQRLPRSASAPAAGRFELETEHDLIGVDVEPLVGGRIRGPEGTAWAGWGVELVDDAATPPYRSGRIELAPNGAFAARLFVEEDSHTVFHVELFDAQGRRRELRPDTVTYTHDRGPVPGEAVLTHAIGVGLADRGVQWMLHSGDALPKERSVVFQTLDDVRTIGQGFVRIPIIEGDKPRADRNRQIGVMNITPRDIRRDVPAGSDVEVTVRADASRSLSAVAYIPVLDEEFPMTVSFGRSFVPDAAAMRGDADELAERITAIRGQISPDMPDAADLLAAVEDEQQVQQIQEQLPAAARDPDAAAECEARIRAVQLALDDVEGRLELPKARADLDGLMAIVRERVASDGTPAERQELAELEADIRAAARTTDPATVRRLHESAADLLRGILRRTGELVAIVFHGLVEECDRVGRTRQMQRAIDEGEAALQRADVAVLESVVGHLRQLLPKLRGAGQDDALAFSTLMLRRRRGR